MEPCAACRKAGERNGHWIVASPFWSPKTVELIFAKDPCGSLEAYFRAFRIWELVVHSLRKSAPQVTLQRIDAYELRESGEVARWHQKVLAWRCCNGRASCAVMYLGSANATVHGFFGIDGKAVNWEAGIIWTGGASLWEHARKVARAGLSALKLPVPGPGDANVRGDDELGPMDSSEAERLFAAKIEQLVRVNQRRRDVVALKANAPFRLLGHDWCVVSLELVIEQGGLIRSAVALNVKAPRKIPIGTHAHVHGTFERKSISQPDGLLPRTVNARLSLFELAPEPVAPAVTSSSSIRVAHAQLGGGGGGGGGGAKTRRKNDRRSSRPNADVRFPFEALRSAMASRPGKAQSWLEGIAKRTRSDTAHLPDYWRRIAVILPKETSP